MTASAPSPLSAGPGRAPLLLGPRAALDRQPWAFRAGLLALFLLALALRLWRLGDLGGFDWDEVATVYIAARPLPDLLAYLRGAPFEHPPLYYLLAHGWLRLGADETTLRSLSALLGALTVPLLGLVAARIGGPRVGLLAAGLLAIAPAHVFYSRDARMYPLLAGLGLVGLYALLRAERGGGRAWWAGWGLAGLGALATHYYAAFLLGGQVAYLLWRRRGDRHALLAAAALGSAASAALLAWAALSPGLRHSLGGLHLAPLAPDAAALSLWRAVAGALRGPFAEEPAPGDEALGALAVLLVAAGAALAWRRPAGALALAAGLLPLVGLVSLMLLGRDLAVRFLVMLLPIALLAAAAGWATRWPNRVGTAVLAAAWLLLAGSWLGPYYREYVRGDYALALRAVEAAERPGEAVVFNGPWQTLLFDHYYRGHLPAHVLTGAVPLVEGQVATALADLAQRYDALWLLETDMGHADPTGFVPRWLARYAYRGAVRDYRQVRLTYYLLGDEPATVTRLGERYPGLQLTEVAVDAAGIAPGRAARLELLWRAEEEFSPGVKASVRVRDGVGTAWWWEDPWVAEGWIAPRPPGPGDYLRTRLAVALPPEAPAGPYTLELVVYGSTERAESGEGWIAWSAPPLRLALDALGQPGPPRAASSP